MTNDQRAKELLAKYYPSLPTERQPIVPSDPDDPRFDGVLVEQEAPSLKCACQPIHSAECVFRDSRSSQYRNFYAAELGRVAVSGGALSAEQTIARILKACDDSELYGDGSWDRVEREAIVALAAHDQKVRDERG